MGDFLKENKRHLTLLCAAVLLLSLLPVFEVWHYLGDKFQGVPPSYIDDNYYYVRMKEIVDGHIWLGNPYFIEHNNDIAPAFVLPDWLYALPLLAGLSLMSAISIDFSFWALVFAVLAYLFFRKMALSKAASALGGLITFAQVYLLILRPVSMQIVFPFFLTFLLAVFAWYQNPVKKRSIIFLAAASALTFYDYGYLWQIIAVACLLFVLGLFCKKDRQRLISLAKAMLVATLLLVPFIMFTLKQIHHPFYWQTMERTGLVYTHLPTALSFITAIWVLGFTLLSFTALKWIPGMRNDPSFSRFAKIYSLIGISMSVVSVSNIITGKELETAQHVGRFIDLWLVMGTIILIYYFLKQRSEVLRLDFLKKLILALLVFLVFLGNISYAGDLLTFVHPTDRVRGMTEAQEYIPAFKWLDAEEKQPKVVWVAPTSQLNAILEIYTKHYVLFSSVGVLQLASNDELKERYLVSSALNDPPLTAESIAESAGVYAGVSRAHHLANTHNRGVKLCRIFHLNLLGRDCGELTDPAAMNTEMAEDMYREYAGQVKPNLENEIEKFHVSYIMKDKVNDTGFHPEQLTNITKVYEDQRFVIYKTEK